MEEETATTILNDFFYDLNFYTVHGHTKSLFSKEEIIAAHSGVNFFHSI